MARTLAARGEQVGDRPSTQLDKPAVAALRALGIEVVGRLVMRRRWRGRQATSSTTSRPRAARRQPTPRIAQSTSMDVNSSTARRGRRTSTCALQHRRVQAHR
jgi:hypothetical protein